VQNENTLFWKQYWHLLCHRSEVEKPRDFVRFDVAGEEVVAFHDGNDVIAFNNLCPHRGARIFDGASGNAPFLCKYHGWSYHKGKIFIADKAQFSHCETGKVALTQLSTVWVGDFLFVASAPAKSIEDQLGAVYELVLSISGVIDQRIDLNSYNYDCIWQVALENALEPYHVGMVHADSLNQLKLGTGVNEFFGANSVWSTDVQNLRSAKRLEKLGNFLSSPIIHSGYLNIHIFPFSMISSTYGLTYSVQNFFPAHLENTTHFASRLYRSKLRSEISPSTLESFFQSTAAVNRKIFEEDRDICARVPRRSWSSAAPVVFAKDEERLVHFRQAYSAALETNNCIER
jgi:phenylpropionate dioxygenase-like ring-hydroxylating dioxygenase large terminal subunit